jgi:hypothetical protein
MNNKIKQLLPIFVTIFVVIFLNKVWARSGPIAVLIVGVIIISIILIGKKIFQKLKENSKCKGGAD